MPIFIKVQCKYFVVKEFCCWRYVLQLRLLKLVVRMCLYSATLLFKVLLVCNFYCVVWNTYYVYTPFRVYHECYRWLMAIYVHWIHHHSQAFIFVEIMWFSEMKMNEYTERGTSSHYASICNDAIIWWMWSSTDNNLIDVCGDCEQRIYGS